MGGATGPIRILSVSSIRLNAGIFLALLIRLYCCVGSTVKVYSNPEPSLVKSFSIVKDSLDVRLVILFWCC